MTVPTAAGRVDIAQRRLTFAQPIGPETLCWTFAMHHGQKPLRSHRGLGRPDLEQVALLLQGGGPLDGVATFDVAVDGRV